jgi:hypothetical protein
MNPDTLKDILAKHAAWLKDAEGGARANLYGADLYGADLSSANLYGADLSSANLGSANLSSANLYGADLSSANLRSANLRSANLRGADLRSANLYGADLSSANLPKIDPVDGFRAKLLGAVEGEGCRLDMRDWHTCNTVHCLAGWCTTIHPQGKLLESIYDTSAAAALILNACGEKIPNFLDTGDGADARAMNWLKTGNQADPS